MFTLTLKLTTILPILLHILSPPTHAHMLLQSPTRFPSQLDALTFNGPLSTTLSGSPSNYPCHFTTASTTYNLCSSTNCINRTVLTPGTNFTTTLLGQSVHGGGSCQFSLSKDIEPTKDSVFKAIHSVIGGCPARNTPGNIGADNDWSAPGPDEYSFTVPQELEEGEYTFAWTWFNKVGNREMYMNCAPIVVGKSNVNTSAQDDFFDNLPDMFLANIPDVPGCASPPSGQTMEFPKPGVSVERNNVGQDVFVAPVVGDGADCYAPLGGGGESVSHSVEASSVSTLTTTSTISVVPVPVQATRTLSSPSPSILSTAQSPPASSRSPTTPFTKIGIVCTPCDHPGALICIDATHFGICDVDNCAIPQPVAVGTICQNGAILSQGVKKEKRDVLVGSNGRGGVVVRERNGRGRWREMRRRV